MSRLTTAVLFVLVALGGVGARHAAAAEGPPSDPTARAEWYSARAEEAFQAGKFEDAIKLYVAAYESAPSASILYNVAFIYDRRLKEPELALDYYQRVAKAADADRTLVDKAQGRITALKAQLDKPDKPDRPPDKPPPDKPPPDKPPPDKPPPEESGHFPVGPVITMSAGGLVLATGLAFGLMAEGTEADFHAAESSADKRSLQATGRDQALFADVCMAVGGAAIVGGLVWLLVDSGSTETEGRVDTVGIAPFAGPGGAGVALGGRF